MIEIFFYVSVCVAFVVSMCSLGVVVHEVTRVFMELNG